MDIQESRLNFIFPDEANVVKFDDTRFYRERYERFSGAKGVDILASTASTSYIIEVKDCSNTARNQDKWRRSYSSVQGMDTLADEIASKVAHTYAALGGVLSYGEQCATASELLPIAKSLNNDHSALCTHRIFVILYLEGDFSCHTRSNRTIHAELRKKILRKLQWLNCRVDVLNTQTHLISDFHVQLKSDNIT